MLAQLYRALRHIGVLPPAIDSMELWQVAVLLGEDIDLVPRLILAVDQPAPTPGEVGSGPRLLDAD